jgi:hypothetical protein
MGDEERGAERSEKKRRIEERTAGSPAITFLLVEMLHFDKQIRAHTTDPMATACDYLHPMSPSSMRHFWDTACASTSIHLTSLDRQESFPKDTDLPISPFQVSESVLWLPVVC